MLIQVYPDNDQRQLKALENDERRFAIALYQGKRGNSDTYEVMSANTEAFRRLARHHGCIALSDFQVRFLRHVQAHGRGV
jgi:hypothetical protein